MALYAVVDKDCYVIAVTLGRAEALRRSMLTYLDDASSPRNAYPAIWAPFALIGEGAAR
jgi:CHAT domain-containing protein